MQPMAYPLVGDDQLSDIPLETHVERVLAFDASRHLAIRGRYPGFFANPDRWGTWKYFAVRSGKRLIRRFRPDAIFSTYPIATAHQIAGSLHRSSGLPWVADFRDSMVDGNYPSDPKSRARYLQIEKETVFGCTRAIFTTASALRMYADRYPEIPDDRWTLIPNGYDEEAFAQIERTVPRNRTQPARRLLLHSGILYPSERDPMPFFRALKALKERGIVTSQDLLVRLRATAHDDHYAPILRDLGIQDIVELAEPLPYKDALNEMMQVDGLLLLQASNCNHQVPAKLYEYMRAQRPIIALTDSAGDTAAILRDVGADNLLPLDDQKVLSDRLPEMLDDLDQGMLKVAPINRVRYYSREHGAADLANVLERVALNKPLSLSER